MADVVRTRRVLLSIWPSRHVPHVSDAAVVPSRFPPVVRARTPPPPFETRDDLRVAVPVEVDRPDVVDSVGGVVSPEGLTARCVRSDAVAPCAKGDDHRLALVDTDAKSGPNCLPGRCRGAVPEIHGDELTGPRPNHHRN